MSAQDDPNLKAMIDATEKFRREVTRTEYSLLKNEREKATFAMMMRMNPEALTAVRKEFFAREDAVKLEEFIYIINKHLINKKGETGFVMETPDQREFGTNMYELFKDIDVNGDGDLEWQEFTTFTVEKANLLNKRAKMASIAHYHESTSSLDSGAQYRHRNDISRFVNIPHLNQFAMLEDHKNCIYLFNSRLAKHVATITTDAAPTACEFVHNRDQDILVTALADMTLATYSLSNPNPNKRYRHMSSWATPGVQIAVAYQPESKLLYTGGVNYNIYSWNIKDRNLVSTLSGHSDIVMSLINLKKLNNVASASLDKTVCVWDSYTNERILHLHGHKKGVFDLTYSTDYRLLFSCGFEHDACVWSPFVNSLVFRLKGHHASLVGCEAIEGTPEIITGDTSGVFKLWDVRNFQCVQTFAANSDISDCTRMTSFFHAKLPSRNAFQREDDSRIYAASKMIFSFDQTRVVHEATTDVSNIFWVAWSEANCLFMTASERNIILWDGLMGSTTIQNTNICGEEISACCLDDRKRKIIIGNIYGKIEIYNPSNGALMKDVINDNPSAVVALEYVDESRRFIAGFADGCIKVFDENQLEDCHVVRTFDSFNKHPELLTLSFNPHDHTVATAGASSAVARLWNYNTGKCEFDLKVCLNLSDHVTFLTYLHPYPLIATTDSRGNVAIWGSIGSKFAGIRIAGFVNQTVLHASPEVQSGDTDGDGAGPTRILAPSVAPTTSTASEMDGTIDHGDNSDDEHSIHSIESKPSNTLQNKRRSGRGKSNSIDDVLSAETVESMKKVKLEFDECEKKWGRTTAPPGLSWNPDGFLLYVGDELGALRCYEMRDLMKDLSGDFMLMGRGKSTAKGICASTPRTSRSALAPIHDTFVRYLVGSPDDAYSYLGINFMWAIPAHNDRIISITSTALGVLTSAADRLVRMWTFAGLPIGVLKKSVPVGQKSQSWNLDIDVESIIKRENEELDDIISRVTDLANSSDLPNMETYDFHGLEPGSNAAKFSRSELRLRIEKTGQLLGLNFTGAHGDDDDQNSHGELESIFSQSSGIVSSSSLQSKSLAAALIELKSPLPSIDYKEKTLKMSLLQRKRKVVKLDQVSKKYHAKTGMKVSVTGENNFSNPGGAGAMSAEEVEELDQLLSLASSNHDKEDESSVNSDMYSVVSKDRHSKKTTRQQSGNNTNRASSLESSIRKFGEKGRRTITLQESCFKYNSYTELDNALSTASPGYNFGSNNNRGVGLLSKEDLEKLKARREEKARRLLLLGSAGSTIVNSSQSSVAESALTSLDTDLGTTATNRGNSDMSHVGVENEGASLDESA